MMKIGASFGKMLSGEKVIREFSTIGIQDEVREKVYLSTDERLLDVTARQWLLGLDPRVFGIWLQDKVQTDIIRRSGKFTMYFMGAAPLRESDLKRNALAVVELEMLDSIEEPEGILFLMKVVHSHIHHINRLKARLLYQKFYKKPGVDFERLKAVAAAYSYPRRVRIISFRDSPEYNYIFPMDLLGDIRPCGRYLLGMRHSNQVLQKIVDIRKIIVSEVPAGYKTAIYKLGRNHSAAPPPVGEYPFKVVETKEFGWYIPEWAESYKEIRIDRTVDLGSHMLLWGKWSENHVLKPDTPHLHHIHFLHFLYLKNKGLQVPLVE
jgi:hypothetical protein